MTRLGRLLATLMIGCTVASLGFSVAAQGKHPQSTSPGYIETVGGTMTKEIPPTASYDVDNSGDFSFDELTEAMTGRYPKMLWPEKYVVSLEDLLATAQDSGRDTWPIGAEFRLLEVPTVCAWLETLDDQLTSGTQFQQAAAIDQTYYVLSGSRAITSGERFEIVDVIQKARLGYAPPLQAYLAHGICSEPVTVGANPIGSPAASPVASPAASRRTSTR